MATSSRLQREEKVNFTSNMAAVVSFVIQNYPLAHDLNPQLIETTLPSQTQINFLLVVDRTILVFRSLNYYLVMVNLFFLRGLDCLSVCLFIISRG